MGDVKASATHWRKAEIMLETAEEEMRAGNHRLAETWASLALAHANVSQGRTLVAVVDRLERLR